LQQPDRFFVRAFGLGVVVLLAYLLFQIFQPFLGPIYWAFLLAFMLLPVNRRVRRRLGGRRGLAAAVMTVGVTLGFAVPAAVGAIGFARQGIELGRKISAAGQRYQIQGPQDLVNLPVFGGAMAWATERLHVDAAHVQTWVVRGSQQTVQFLLARSGDVLFGALGMFGNLALTLFVLYFFFRDGDTMAARAWGLIPIDARRKEALDRRLQAVTRGVVIGTVLTALSQGALLAVGLWIAGVSSPLVFGAVGAVASFVPFVGTALVWVPAAIWVYTQGVVWKTIFLVLWGALVVGSADNFLRPLFVSGQTEIGTLTVFFGVLGGLAAFGFIGIFLGPVILALAMALIEFTEEKETATPGPSASS
jgi:predicted PurR-regulated permease PerM